MFQSSASARDAAWLDAKTLSRPLDSPTRKRQRPDAAGPALDLKLEFAGFELVHSADPAVHSADPHSNLLLEAAAALLARVAPAAAQNPLVLENLSRDGFDSAAALAFAAPDELARAGISPADASAVASTARQRVAVALAPPPPLSSPSTVSHWLMQCGIPDQSAFQYAEKLCRLGYASPPELELVLHDARAISSFRLGHGRLFLHCVAAAVHALQLQTQRMLLAPVQHVHDHNVQPLPFASSSAMLTPVDLQRESELDAQVYDGFLDALMDHDDDHSDHSDHDMLGMQTDPFMAAMAAPMAAPMPSPPLRMLPPELMSLLHEAVNQPRPNACRRGKKIYWSVLATNGLKDPRFAPLATYSAKELQTAYVTQFEPHAMISSPPAVQHSPVPSTAVASAPAAKPDAWSEDNIKQLERAVKDPRCRHLSKVCWEMLATGRTGVDEYAPLAKFSASQLRSRFRSLFGDKRPQKLRQKKQMQKLQQQQAQQAQQAQQQHQVKKEESVAL